MFKSLHFVYWTFPTQPSLWIVVYSYSKSPSLLSGCCVALYFVLPLLRKKKSLGLYTSAHLWLDVCDYECFVLEERTKHQSTMRLANTTSLVRRLLLLPSLSSHFAHLLRGAAHYAWRPKAWTLKKHLAHVQSLPWAKALHCEIWDKASKECLCLVWVLVCKLVIPCHFCSREVTHF